MYEICSWVTPNSTNGLITALCISNQIWSVEGASPYRFDFYCLAFRVVHQTLHYILQTLKLFIQYIRIRILNASVKHRNEHQLSTQAVNLVGIKCRNSSIKSRYRVGCRSVSLDAFWSAAISASTNLSPAVLPAR